MNDDFEPLFEFLQRVGPEASGRAFAQPDLESATKLDRFARGFCPPEERREICEMLRLHPAWLRWLADRVKMARPQAAGL